MKDTPFTPSGCGTAPKRARSVGRWRGGFIALASLVTLAAVGCSNAGSLSPPVNGRSQGSGGTSGTSGQPGQGSASAHPGPSSSGGTSSWGTHAAKPETSGVSKVSGVEGGALFGGDVPLTHETGKLGRNLAIVRVYFRVGERFDAHQFNRLMNKGTTLLVSLDAAPRHGGPTYASIAAGKYDGTIKAFMENVNKAAVQHHLGAIYFCFEHEADAPAHLRLGSPAEFVKAWDHIHQLAADAHLNWQQGGRLHWVMILLRAAYIPAAQQPRWARKEGLASQYWPGNHEADIVAVDGYNAVACRTVHVADYVAPGTRALTPTALFGPVVSFAQTHGNAPVFVAEWGTVPYREQSVVPNWIREMQQFVTGNHEVAAALYWNQRGTNSCNYVLNNQPSSLSALAAMGHSSALRGHVS